MTLYGEPMTFKDRNRNKADGAPRYRIDSSTGMLDGRAASTDNQTLSQFKTLCLVRVDKIDCAESVAMADQAIQGSSASSTRGEGAPLPDRSRPSSGGLRSDGSFVASDVIEAAPGRKRVLRNRSHPGA